MVLASSKFPKWDLHLLSSLNTITITEVESHINYKIHDYSCKHAAVLQRQVQTKGTLQTKNTPQLGLRIELLAILGTTI